VVSALTAEQQAALEVARGLARAGVPLFLARADPGRPTGFQEPYGWHRAEPDPEVADQWRPGMALCAVMGRALDLVDIDPRNGARPLQEDLPTPYLESETPSGGQHLFVAPLGLESRDGAWPGVDYKGGAPDGSGRGYAFIAPTVRRSKVDGLERPYRWVAPPTDPGYLAVLLARPRLALDDSGRRLADRVRELRSARPAEGAPRRIPVSAAAREWARAVAALEGDVRRWAASGWGGEAHAGLLRHSTHLARLSPERAEEGYLWAFASAGVEPDEDDLAKLASAVDAAVPDEVVPDEQASPQERFWAGVQVSGDPKAEAPADPLGRPERGPFAFLTEEEAAAIPLPDPLVDGLLFLGTKARLFGESTRGKTWVALDLAAHVSCGLPWLGRSVKQGPALYVAAEGAPSFHPRMRTWALAHDGRRSGVLFWPEAVPVGGPGWGAFCEAVAREGFVLVIGDTQAAMTVGRREDSNDDAAEVQAAWSELVLATGACYLSVHHVGWADQGRPRGASGMFGGMDTELRLAEGRGGELLVVQEKQRYAEKGAATRLRLAPEHGGLVVRPPLGEAEGLVTASEQEVRVANLYARLRAYADSGGDLGRAGERTVLALLNGVLREQFGAREEPEVTLREARAVAAMVATASGVRVRG